MKASETKLQPIIEGTKQYVVPLFQRPYSWTKKEWGILWDDIVELCETGGYRSHFIGSIVTMPTISVPEGVTKYLLIDGQQRLTTIFILLAVLRDKAKQNGLQDLSEEINNTLLVNPYKRGLDYYKLQPTQVDRYSFQKIITADPLSSDPLSSQNQILNAYQFFERKFRQTDIDIQTLKKTVTNNISVVSIVLDTDDNPHLVFESLNAKGMPLTQADLIRNYFFMRIHVNEQENIYSRYWEPMQVALGENLTEFIRHYLMKDGKTVKQGDVYFALKDIVSQGNALDYLKELLRFSDYYKKLLSPEYETNSEIRKLLSRLNRFEVNTAYPFLLNCYDDYSQGKISAEEFIDILRVIENYLIRRFVCNVPTHGLNKIFPSLYVNIKNKGFGREVDGLKKVLQTKGYPKDMEFKSRLMDAKLYGAGDRAIKTKLILESIEESYGHKEQISFDNLSIEHIMPQTLTEYWQNHLGDDWEITYELLLHTIGNLTLTAYNSELSNDDFESKKKRLCESHLEMNKYFKDKKSWKKEDIEKRSEHLAERALSIWHYFGDDITEQQNTTEVTGTTPKKLWILGQSFDVQTWRDVLEQTMNTIADLEPDKFEQIIQQFPRMIGRDKKKFRAVRELKNGAFIEVNLSAKNIQRFCFQILEAVELTADDWKVEVE
jgi:uncharacterized protein with ParB-like and HNH nuclease domain